MRENRWPEITSKLLPKAGGAKGKDSGAVTAEHNSFIHSLHHLPSDTMDSAPSPCPGSRDSQETTTKADKNPRLVETFTRKPKHIIKTFNTRK